MNKKLIFNILIIILLTAFIQNIYPQETEDCLSDANATSCSIDLSNSNNFLIPNNNLENNKDNILGIVYFTGVGCPHCAKVDPILLGKMPFENNNLAIIEYEVKLNKENATLFVEYNKEFSTGLGYPLIILGKNESYLSTKILPVMEEYLKNNKTSPITVLTSLDSSNEIYFSSLEYSKLPGKPVIWYNNKVAVRYFDGETPIDDKLLLDLLNETDLTTIDQKIRDQEYHTIDEKKIQLSQSEINFDNVVHIPGWKIYWNGDTSLEYVACPIDNQVIQEDCAEKKKIPLWTVVSLALVDAVNPCEFAVLIMLLIAIMSADPTKKKRVLYSGLAFTSAIFILYFIYGLLLINIFKLVPAIDSIRTIIYTGIAIVAIVIGLLQLKDFFNYKPGGFATEMPLSFRPKVKKLISSITSPGGAFVVGAFVTLFLMPCTIGPYVILGNLLATETILAAIPQLFLYNVIFIIPMLAITLGVYFGIRKVNEVAEWKEKNIKYMHLIAGIIMLLIGIGMLLGWF